MRQGVWTPDTIEQLKALHAEGHTDQEISKRLKVSRNAVLGKRHRLGLTGHTQLAPKRGKPKQKLLAWNEPDPNDPNHAIDTRDLAILDEMAKGRQPAAIAKEFKTPEIYVRGLWTTREQQEPVGEDA